MDYTYHRGPRLRFLLRVPAASGRSYRGGSSRHCRSAPQGAKRSGGRKSATWFRLQRRLGGTRSRPVATPTGSSVRGIVGAPPGREAQRRPQGRYVVSVAEAAWRHEVAASGRSYREFSSRHCRSAPRARSAAAAARPLRGFGCRGGLAARGRGQRPLLQGVQFGCCRSDPVHGSAALRAAQQYPQWRPPPATTSPAPE